MGFKCSREVHAYAAQGGAEDAAKKAQDATVSHPRGRGSGAGLWSDRRLAFAASAGFTITSIATGSPIPHNGCPSSQGAAYDDDTLTAGPNDESAAAESCT